MQVRETVHSPPFWASASNSNASNPSSTSPYSTSTSSSTQSGIRPWIIVLVFSIVLLLFLPSILSTPFKSGRFSLSIKSGWDVLNLCLVVFAILCGVLGRIGDGSGRESGSYKQPRSEWTGFSNPTAGMRRTRNSSSYPDLRLETDVWVQNRVPDSWRFFDDAELYRNRRPVQLYGVSGQGEEERECRTILAHTERFPQLEQQAENETNFEQVKMESGTIYEEKKGSETMVVRRRRRSLEALPKWEEVETGPMVTVGRFPSIEEVEKEVNFQNVLVHVEEEVDKRQMAVRRRRKSLENFPKMNEIEEETKFEEEMVEKESEPAGRKAKSSEELPEIEETEQDTNFEENVVEKPPLVVEVAPPPPPPPPPPPLPEIKVAEECRKHKRSGSGGGAKDLASAITHFYQKKKQGNKSKRKEKHEVSIEPNPNPKSSSTTEGNSNPNPSTAAPPPPPSSIFYKFLSNKKAPSKSRKIHSLSASTHSTSPSTVNIISTSPTPPPPPPQPPHQGLHRSRTDQVASLGYRRIEDTELYEYRRRERLNVSSYANYPLPPRSPLPPAPPPPPPPPSESREQQVQKNGSVAVFWASPDVNDKADLFIKRFRDGLKMEIINSIKEKEKRKERQNEDNDAIHI